MLGNPRAAAERHTNKHQSLLGPTQAPGAHCHRDTQEQVSTAAPVDTRSWHLHTPYQGDNGQHSEEAAGTHTKSSPCAKNIKLIPVLAYTEASKDSVDNGLS